MTALTGAEAALLSVLEVQHFQSALRSAPKGAT